MSNFPIFQTTNPAILAAYIIIRDSRNSKKNVVWSKAKVRPGRDPAWWREDRYGNLIYFDHYGKDDGV